MHTQEQTQGYVQQARAKLDKARAFTNRVYTGEISDCTVYKALQEEGNAVQELHDAIAQEERK
jgi:hypothetical protein